MKDGLNVMEAKKGFKYRKPVGYVAGRRYDLPVNTTRGPEYNCLEATRLANILRNQEQGGWPQFLCFALKWSAFDEQRANGIRMHCHAHALALWRRSGLRIAASRSESLPSPGPISVAKFIKGAASKTTFHCCLLVHVRSIKRRPFHVTLQCRLCAT